MPRSNKTLTSLYFWIFDSNLKLLHLERFIAILIVMCLITVALYEYRIILNRARCIAALAEISEVRNRLIFYQSMTGDWPDSEEDLGPIEFRPKEAAFLSMTTAEAAHWIILRGQVSRPYTQFETAAATAIESPKYIVADGTVTVKVPGISLRDEPIALLSMRHAASKTAGMAALKILCGDEKADNRIAVFGPNHTNIYRISLPWLCR